MEGWFYPGQKVVCLNDEWAAMPDGFRESSDYPCPLKAGDVYTIRAVGENNERLVVGPLGAFFMLTNATILELAEVQNPFVDNSDAPVTGFCASRFRPLEEKSDTTEQERELVA